TRCNAPRISPAHGPFWTPFRWFPELFRSISIRHRPSRRPFTAWFCRNTTCETPSQRGATLKVTHDSHPVRCRLTPCAAVAHLFFASRQRGRVQRDHVSSPDQRGAARMGGAAKSIGRGRRHLPLVAG